MGILGNEAEAGCVSVQAVHGMVRKSEATLSIIVHDRVCQGAGPLTARLVHEHSRRLINDEEPIILVGNIEIDGLRRNGIRRGEGDFDDIAFFYEDAQIRCRTVSLAKTFMLNAAAHAGGYAEMTQRTCYGRGLMQLSYCKSNHLTLLRNENSPLLLYTYYTKLMSINPYKRSTMKPSHTIISGNWQRRPEKAGNKAYP